MPLEKFEIRLDSPYKSYFAGQNVTGKVFLSLNGKSKLIHGIKIKIQGKAKTHWKETSGRTTSHFSRDEIYIDEKVYLLGYENENFEMTLEEGSHQYPFSFLLPANCPSSFCHKYGHVKYLLEATVTRNRKSNYVCKSPFSVNGVLDLNSEPEAAKEGEIANEKVVCCFACASPPLGFTLHLSKKGFVPGERVGFNVHMYNHSNRPITCTAISLVQNINFLADWNRSKSKRVQILQVEGPKLKANGEKEWIVTSDVSPLKIPSLPPSRLEGCKIIDITYQIKFKMEVKNSSTLKECLSILIGTVPLRDDFYQIRGQAESADGVIGLQSATADISVLPSPYLLPLHPDLPPPSYEDAVNGVRAEDAESTCSDPPDYGALDWKSFIPKYVSYKFAEK